MLRRFVYGTIALVADAIESVGSGEYREDLLRRLQECARRGADLAFENSRLRRELDRLRFNGPSLWRDEVEALRRAIDLFNVGAPVLAGSISTLLKRCDHMPMTQDELNEQCREIIEGETEAILWDDPGAEVE